MKKRISLFAFTICTVIGYAQTNYTCVYVPLHKKGNLLNDSVSFKSANGEIYQCVLQGNAKHSVFYVVQNTLHAGQDTAIHLMQDAESDSADAHHVHMTMHVELPLSYDDTTVYVVKDFIGKRILFKYTNEFPRIVMSNLYADTLYPMEWKTDNHEIRNFGNLMCFKATTVYKNQRIEAWYCPDIPISDGPWKLGGLPGLIVSCKIGDNDGFTLSSFHTSQSTSLFTDHIQSILRKSYPGYQEFRKFIDKEVHQFIQKARVVFSNKKQNCVQCATQSMQELYVTIPYEGISYHANL
ncbi:GLPGLI family protein [Thermoflavifilum thermophilum]|uniref:GLPGLI family protein n=1 Tax=Thermoflavifilum thermophilum TaxID=1393122 RepID=A0A1I7N9R6_9BACT|nr:GLPGLI family protein [Thermoflavifilum thermophilum]SFV31296.1 GLPGLI family protein [Thermoflavifilum thermophilum]